MKRWLRYWWLIVLACIPVGYRGWQKWQFWNNYERNIVWDNWTVNLPQGGTVTYRNQSPQMRPILGPADTTKLLIWQKPNGQTQQYPISNTGAGYRDLEFLVRPNGRGVWLTSWDWKQTVATLDLDTGRFTAGAVPYDKDGN